MKLYGLSGTNGSGKDSVADFLVKNHGFLFVSVSDLLRKEAKNRGEAIEREVLRTISAEWRREHGLGVLVDKAVEFYKSQGGDDDYSGLVVASLRNPGEVKRIHELGGEVIWIDADPKIRYDRIYIRQRTAEDDKTFEQFELEEKAEMQHSGDEATLSLSGVKETADKTLINNENSLESLAEKVRIEIVG